MNPEEFKTFIGNIGDKWKIRDCESLFKALTNGAKPTARVGNNAYWNSETSVFVIKDEIWNDFAIIIKHKGRSYLYRNSEALKFFNKDAFLHAYEDITCR